MSQVMSPPLPAPPPAPAAPRFASPTVIAVFGGLLAGILIVVIAVVFVRRPPGPEGCQQLPCPVHLANARANGVVWSTDLGLSTEYPDYANVVESTPRLLVLGGGEITVRVEVAPSSEMTPLQLLQHELDVMEQSISTLDTDCVKIANTEWADACTVHPDRILLGPAVGYVDGIGGMWGGTSEAGAQLEVVILAAQRDGVTVAVVLSTTSSFGGWGSRWQGDGAFVDDISNSIIWPGDR